MKITLKSQYDHFTTNQKPKYIEWTNEPAEITCYANEFVKTINTPTEKSIALLIEPRSLYPDIYEWMEENNSRFKYVFTHDSRLLQKDNAKLILFGGVWESRPAEKTKNISMISSQKTLCPLHRTRLRLAYELATRIDCYGYNGHRIDTISAHAPYRYAVVIENYIDNDWFTEKICNCFANKTIPIYVGARNIGKYFNADGIIQIVPEDLTSIIVSVQDVVKSLKPEEEYNKHLEAIEDNYRRVQDYYCFEDWFYKKYKDLLEGV